MLATVLTASAFAFAFCMALAVAIVARELETRVETLESELRTERRILRTLADDFGKARDAADAQLDDVYDALNRHEEAAARQNQTLLDHAPNLVALGKSVDAVSLASARASAAVARYLEDVFPGDRLDDR